MVHDTVEKELVKEVETIESILSLLQRTLEQTNEQLRLIRSTKYFIDRDRADKVEAMKIDNECLSLKETSLNLSYYVGTGRLDSGYVKTSRLLMWYGIQPDTNVQDLSFFH